MNYQQLTAADRGAIEVLLQEHYTQIEIAGKLGVNPSTVSREIKMRGTPSGYYSRIAQEHYERLRQRCRRKRKLSDTKRQKHVAEKLESGWSPEQIAGRLKLENNPLYICKETIYQFLYTDKWAKEEEKLYQYLRYGRKKRKKQTGRSVHRSKIPNRVSIHDRPEIISRRIEYGHCESDSVIYPYKFAINSINELSCGIVRFTKLDRKTAQLTREAMIKRSFELNIKSFTVDNGTEHMEHEEVKRQAGIPVFFADPYASWQRGANENANMLLRGYLPKRTNITNLTQEELDDVADELNNRPRKRLGYRTPNEVYYKMLKLEEVNNCSRN